MPNCAVYGCSNYSRKTKGTDIKYFTFPKDDEIAKKWLTACKREDKVNLTHACICSIHFSVSSFAIPLRQQLLSYTTKNTRNLKPEAVPTEKLPMPKSQKCNEMVSDKNVVICHDNQESEKNSVHRRSWRTLVWKRQLCRLFIARKMTERLEQRYCIKFCQKLGDSQVETIRKIQTAFGDDAMGITQIKEWYNRFKDGRTSVESHSRSGRPSTCRNDQVIAQVNAAVMRDRDRDRRVTIRQIAKQVGISTSSAHTIMTEDLATKRVAPVQNDSLENVMLPFQNNSLKIKEEEMEIKTDFDQNDTITPMEEIMLPLESEPLQNDSVKEEIEIKNEPLQNDPFDLIKCEYQNNKKQKNDKRELRKRK